MNSGPSANSITRTQSLTMPIWLTTPRMASKGACQSSPGPTRYTLSVPALLVGLSTRGVSANPLRAIQSATTAGSSVQICRNCGTPALSSARCCCHLSRCAPAVPGALPKCGVSTWTSRSAISTPASLPGTMHTGS